MLINIVCFNISKFFSSPSPTLEMNKLFFSTFMVCFLLFTSSFIEIVIAKPVFCDKTCKKRCSKAGVMDRCIKYCGICCGFCKCVPSGTYGNKHECPCYRDMRNSKGRPKCP